MLAQDEKLGSIVREPNKRSSWDAHSSSHNTHGFEGAWGTTLEAEWDQNGKSLPYIGTKALGRKSPNWSAIRSLMAS